MLASLSHFTTLLFSITHFPNSLSVRKEPAGKKLSCARACLRASPIAGACVAEVCQEGQKKGWKEGSQEASEDVKGCEECWGGKTTTKQNKMVRKIDGARHDSGEGED